MSNRDMTIQPHTVTPDALDAATTVIIDARDDLAYFEVAYAKAAHAYNEDAAELAIGQRILMARSDAGTNDAARRAYADRESIAARDALARLGDELLAAEISVIRAKKELAKALDNRRLLEAIMRLDENSREDYAA